MTDIGRSDPGARHGTGEGERSSVPANRISQIIHGKRAITGDTALWLGHWFKTSAEFWLNLQTAYDLRIAADEVGRFVAKLPTRPEIKGRSKEAA